MALTPDQRAVQRAIIKAAKAALRGPVTRYFPQVARAAIHQVVDGKPVVNVVHITCPAAPTSAQLQGLADALAGTWFTNMSSRLSALWSMGPVVVQGLNSGADPTAISVLHDGAIGTNGENAVARSVCVIVNLTTGLGGRSNRGKLFISGVTPTGFTDQTAGTVQPGWLVGTQVAIQKVNTDLGEVGAGLVIASSTTGQVHPVTQAVVSAQAGSLRRRLHS